MGESYIFTFGVGHALAGYCVELCGDYQEAREEMVRLFDNKWASQYDRKQGRQLIEEWKYTQLRVNSDMCPHKLERY